MKHLGMLALCLILPTLAWAGEYHTSPTLSCSDCHTMHYSVSGGPPPGGQPGGPFSELLLFQTTNGLCLSCHDGTDVTAPDVVQPVTMYSGSGDEHSGAGFFQNSGGLPSDDGHDLGVAAATVPLSSMSNLSLTCASCHDPHGNTNYRNLLNRPGVGLGTTVVLGTDVFENVAPLIPPTREGSIQAYKESNIGYKSKTSSWCAECHDILAQNSTGSSPAHFSRHPSNVGLSLFGYHSDPSHWVGGSGRGFGATTGDASEGVPRLRFQVSTATNYSTSKVVSTANEVFCASCHLAHGENYDSGTVWPYKTSATEADLYSPCEQCHYK